jgi:hypothetical protein
MRELYHPEESAAVHKTLHSEAAFGPQIALSSARDASSASEK